jgi:hypothetical protein
MTPNDQGQSPLTIGATDQIPLAIAFQETINVMMSGDNHEKLDILLVNNIINLIFSWKSRIVGEMLISFPASFVNLILDPSRSSNTLEFRLKNLDNIENIRAKPSLITQ